MSGFAAEQRRTVGRGSCELHSRNLALDVSFAPNHHPIMESKTLLVPGHLVDRPDRDRLAARFEFYQAAN